jgi:hypothetical protein
MIIGFLARSFGISTLLSTVIVYGSIALAAWGAWQWRFHSGVVQGRAEVLAQWEKAREAERDRVAKAVAEAQAEAQKTIDALEDKEEALNAELEKARAEADNDPASNDGGIGAGSVRFLNRLR